MAIREVGTPAPDFSSVSGEGDEVSLSALRGKPVVLYFYPEDDTPTCIKQACGFRDAWRQIQQTGAALYGVSPDSAESHQKFTRKYRLPFPLLVDEGHRIADLFGVWDEKTLFGHRYQGILRTTFVIDGEGIIRHVFKQVRAKGHADAVLQQIERVMAGEMA